jgi:hypothetical protein
VPKGGFNPRARWNISVPGNLDLEPGILNEPVEVLACFKSCRITPKVFIWNNKEYHVEAVTYSWQERLGCALISYFSVLCADQVYQISFNNSTFRWQIDKLIS